MSVKVRLNYLRIAPRKARLVASLIKGMDVERAEAELNHLLKKAAVPFLKLLRSALAAEGGSRNKNFYLKSVTVNQGPVWKRYRPRAFGRAAPVRKRTSHVILELAAREENGVRMEKTEKETPAATAEKKKLPEIAVKTGEKKQTGARAKPVKRKENPSASRARGFAGRVFSRKAI